VAQHGFLDFVGYPVGVPDTEPEVGYRGIVDWTGLPAGAVTSGPRCGLVGIIDWTGIPCGGGTTARRRGAVKKKKRLADWKRRHDDELILAMVLGLEDE